MAAVLGRSSGWRRVTADPERFEDREGVRSWERSACGYALNSYPRGRVGNPWRSQGRNSPLRLGSWGHRRIIARQHDRVG